jgi:hypothetical protein
VPPTQPCAFAELTRERREQDPRPERDRDALSRADVFATGMRDESRLIVRADSSITASC